MRRIINKRVYDTKTATQIATNNFRHGANQYYIGRTTTLYKTKKGNFFIIYLTCWGTESDKLEPVSKDKATELYEQAYSRCVEFEEAFPDVEIDDA